MKCPTQANPQRQTHRLVVAGAGEGGGEEAKPLNGDRVSYRGDGMFWN